MMAVDAFVKTYGNAVPAELNQRVEADGGILLGSLLLARVDGKSPAEYLTDDKLREKVRKTGLAILAHPDITLEAAIDCAADALAEEEEQTR